MRHILLYTLLILVSFSVTSQSHHQNHHSFYLENNLNSTEESYRYTVNDSSFDVGFYHLDVEVSIDSAYISGVVKYGLTASENGLNHISLDLDSAFSVDSVWGAAANFVFTNNVITINLNGTYNQGDTFSLFVSYRGIPILAGGYKGLRYESHDANEPIIATLW